MKNAAFATILAFAVSICSWTARSYTMEDRFQSLMITTGYSTILGAACGLAFLGLTKQNPQKNWQDISMGASIGFFTGIGYGVYALNTQTPNYNYSSEAQEARSSNFRLTFTPVFNSQGVSAFAANLAIPLR